MAGFKDHPELFIQFLKSDPGFRNVLEKNPRMEEMLNDPTTIDYLIDMMSSPDSMRDALRQTDEALNHVGDIPGGEQMLERVMSVRFVYVFYHAAILRAARPSARREGLRQGRASLDVFLFARHTSEFVGSPILLLLLLFFFNPITTQSLRLFRLFGIAGIIGIIGEVWLYRLYRHYWLYWYYWFCRFY